MASVVPSAKYPVPSPRRESGITDCAIVMTAVLANAYPKPCSRRTPISTGRDPAGRYSAHATTTTTSAISSIFRRPRMSTRYPETSRATVAPTTNALDAKPPTASEAAKLFTAYSAMVVTSM